MNKATMIDKLNDILRWEWKAVIQYTEASFLVQDVWREVYEPLFRKGAEESLGHARQIGNKIVALGGTPTTEHAEVHQSTDLHDLLHQSLDIERGAVRHYNEALDLCLDDAPLRVLLEDIILEEQEGVEHLEKILGTHAMAGAGHGSSGQSFARQPR